MGAQGSPALTEARGSPGSAVTASLLPGQLALHGPVMSVPYRDTKTVSLGSLRIRYGSGETICPVFNGP